MVAAVDIGPSAGLDGVVEELRKLGAEALPCTGTWPRADAPARVVDEAVRRSGLDGLVSNAGINVRALTTYEVRDWDLLFAVNTRATWLLAKAAHPALKARAAPSSPPARCPAVTPTPISAPTGRARPPSSCWCRCSRKSRAATASGSTPCHRNGATG